MSDFYSLYSNMIAGSIPEHKGNAYASVIWKAQEVLQTERVHTHIVKYEGSIYYLAIPSVDYATSHKLPVCLAKALPGGAFHQGEGVYVIKQGKYSVALSIDRDNVDIVFNETAVIEVFLEDKEQEGFDIYHWDDNESISDPDCPLLTTAFHQVQHKLDKMMNYLGVIALSTTLIAASVGFLLSSSKPMSEIKGEFAAKAEAYKTASLNAINGIYHSNDIAKQARRLQEVSSSVVKSGGWIDSYEINDKYQENMEARLPAWVTRDYLDALGADIQTLIDKKENMVVVYKNQISAKN